MSEENVEIIENGPSILGTRQYWDDIYKRDNKNFEDFGDIGDSWFGEESVTKMVDWVVEHYPEPEKTIIDLGCGNGEVLLGLAEEGFKNLTGIDYSEYSIELSKKVAAKEGYEFIKFETVDFLNDSELSTLGKYDIILDKGTYDAISLNPDNKLDDENSPINVYPKAVKQLMNKDSVFLITSCNYTEEELKLKFKNYFKDFSRVKYPSIQFGGVEGQTICTLAFKLIDAE
ncbi:S-adenosyl-L-methionine-dependent methyltransferase [Anaeromyces robustus]|uniref:Protein-lysine N-methyltransferase EFM4 n=1 Tax=Anaeromyces robustus TaxID=1754192 RepID=A0A1Y1XKH4_9FUNG|nr:S-adenosyl-L-methionine-dependent methyltransferase [Anaeromyces robustus]|eukprot:ORX86260.1 S-adenosyl-L-methionine-dependent methyltransferase [Anaeromyces robustus]